MKPITVLLAEDHTVVREGLRVLLESEGDIRVIGEASNGRQAVALTEKLHPAVVVMDIAMPLLNGLEATRQILKVYPAARVLILSAHGEDVYIEQVVARGAAGYLLKHTSARILAHAVREVHKGLTFFSPSVARHMNRLGTASGSHPHAPSHRSTALSPREAEVLQRVAEGQANKVIAAELGISIKTVEKHRQNLMVKLGIHDTAGLTRHAIAAGVIESNAQLTIL